MAGAVYILRWTDEVRTSNVIPPIAHCLIRGTLMTVRYSQKQQKRPPASTLPAPEPETKWCVEKCRGVAYSGRCHAFAKGVPNALPVDDSHQSCSECRAHGRQRTGRKRFAACMANGAVCVNGAHHPAPHLEGAAFSGYCDKCQSRRARKKARAENVLQRSHKHVAKPAMAPVQSLPTPGFIRRLGVDSPTRQAMVDHHHGRIVLDTPVRLAFEVARDAFAHEEPAHGSPVPVPSQPPIPAAAARTVTRPVHVNRAEANHEAEATGMFVSGSLLPTLPMHSIIPYATPTPPGWASTARGRADRHFLAVGAVPPTRTRRARDPGLRPRAHLDDIDVELFALAGSHASETGSCSDHLRLQQQPGSISNCRLPILHDHEFYNKK